MFTCIHFLWPFGCFDSAGNPFPFYTGNLFSPQLNKGPLTSTAEIKGFVGPLSHQAGDDRSPSISGTNFKLATGDFLSMPKGTADITFPTTAISSLALSSVTEKQVKIEDFKI